MGHMLLQTGCQSTLSGAFTYIAFLLGPSPIFYAQRLFRASSGHVVVSKLPRPLSFRVQLGPASASGKLQLRHVVIRDCKTTSSDVSLYILSCTILCFLILKILAITQLASYRIGSSFP